MESLRTKEQIIFNEIVSEHNLETFHDYENHEIKQNLGDPITSPKLTPKKLQKLNSFKTSKTHHSPKLERKNQLNQQNYEVISI